MTTPHQPALFTRSGPPRIILMDLNLALSSNFDQMRRHKFASFITSVETYRQWMVELLRDEYTILITARDHRWADATLTRIHQQTGWTPQEAFFNDTGLSGQNAPLIKRQLVNTYVLPEHGHHLTRYLAIESNSATREMYANMGIKAIDCERSDHRKWVAIPD